MRPIKEQKTAYWGEPPKIFFVRRTFAPPVLPPVELTRETPIVAIRCGDFVAMAYPTSIRKGIWAGQFHPHQPLAVDGKKAECVIVVGRGEVGDANVDEQFIFVELPPELAGLDEAERVEKLTRWAFDLVIGEGLEMQRQGELQEQERRAKHPVRIDEHEDKSVDHHNNHAHVGLGLLAADYPHLAEVAREMDTSQSDGVPEDLKLKRLKAFLLDYKRHSGTRPKIAQSDAAILFGDSEFLEQLVQPNLKGGTAAVKWQIWRRWIAGDYYRMQQEQLEEAFARDWTAGRVLNKGASLAKTARRMGLKSALKMGPKG